MSERIEPFTLHVPDEDLADLRRRLAAVRWPAGGTVTDTSQGPTQDKLAALVAHWRDKYDWRAARPSSTAWASTGPPSTGSASTSCTSAQPSPAPCH